MPKSRTNTFNDLTIMSDRECLWGWTLSNLGKGCKCS